MYSWRACLHETATWRQRSDSLNSANQRLIVRTRSTARQSRPWRRRTWSYSRPPTPSLRRQLCGCALHDIVEVNPTDNLRLQIWAREAMRVMSGAVGVQRDTSYQWASRGVARREASVGEVQSQASASIAQGGPGVFCSKIEGAALAMWLLSCQSPHQIALMAVNCQFPRR